MKLTLTLRKKIRAILRKAKFRRFKPNLKREKRKAKKLTRNKLENNDKVINN